MLGLDDDEAVRAAYDDVVRAARPARSPSPPMAPPGVEVALGIVRDPMFGPLVLVAAGGVLVELLHDRRLALPPLDEAGARRLIDGLQMRPLLDGVRGAGAADRLASPTPSRGCRCSPPISDRLPSST